VRCAPAMHHPAPGPTGRRGAGKNRRGVQGRDGHHRPGTASGLGASDGGGRRRDRPAPRQPTRKPNAQGCSPADTPTRAVLKPLPCAPGQARRRRRAACRVAPEPRGFGGRTGRAVRQGPGRRPTAEPGDAGTLRSPGAGASGRKPEERGLPPTRPPPRRTPRAADAPLGAGRWHADPTREAGFCSPCMQRGTRSEVRVSPKPRTAPH